MALTSIENTSCVKWLVPNRIKFSMNRPENATSNKLCVSCCDATLYTLHICGFLPRSMQKRMLALDAECVRGALFVNAVPSI